MSRAVELLPHSPAWRTIALVESERLAEALCTVLVAVHHIGSTAIPGIAAKPIIDLMPEVVSLAALDDRADALTTLGYEWKGENGIVGRRFATLADAMTGKRLVHFHAFETGSSHVLRHLAFRDYLRAYPERARAYEALKRRARDLHPHDPAAYTEAKGPWIRAMEVEALDFYRAQSSG